jgi:L-alanine-DL-glutamate epimerase-like enolase superfamily enzyme
MPDGALGLLSQARAELPPGDEGSVITSAQTYALSVPLHQAIADATASLTAWTVPVVEIRTADGRVGTGISGVHCGPELLCQVIDRYYAPALLGASSEDILGTWKRLYWLPTHWIGRAGNVHMGLSMVDIVLWDLAAQRAEVPLWRLLGGTADAIETYNTDGGWLNLGVADVVRDLTSLVDRGWRRVKIKVGKPDWREDAQIAGHAAARGLRLVPHAGDMMQVHQHLVGTVLTDSPPLVEFIPWTHEVFRHRSVVRDGFVERPQAPGASTAVAAEARERLQVKQVGATATLTR